ncbi:hypothetical protein EJ02DRAFT_405735 [Clathrospora elynae]|uniref:Nephrocystin 3-like N-terminal domain-containing protein n=1 Tax=Clathrospora elynae TaxID=706981 RepID=A0A6A5SN38_9PLEO|nr:hypothetical protein EJ02DRAFT_405735 [Clathrospora elynae]
MSSQTETADMTMMDTGAERPLFDETIEAIQTTILEEHRQQFHHDASVSLLLDELLLVSAGSGSGDHRLIACSRKFSMFIRSFAPYFDVLSTCVTLKPEWVGWFWGTVRLVFKVGSGYAFFLEKIADMFEAIANIVPPYQQIYEVCRHDILGSHLDDQDGHLATLMSYVYTDLVQLCLDFYRVFCRGTQGCGLRHLTLGTTQAALWRPLDSRFARLEARLTRHRRWLEKETENQVQDYANVAQHRKNYLNFLHRHNEVNSHGHAEHEEHRMAKRMRIIEKAQSWLSSSPVADKCDHSLQLYPDSCAWFLGIPAYCRWRDQPFDRSTANDTDALESTWQHRVLFVQAKLGFGKTCISHSVIANLAAEAEGPDLSDEPPVTASYHFSRSSADSSHFEDAFRAIACQLLQTHRQDRSTLDATCLLLRKTSCREHAIAHEVLDVISLLLRQHPTFLVFDGIDECSDTQAFLTSFEGLCRGSDTKVVLFSRPNLKIPLEYQKWASAAPHIISLTKEHNAAAIEHHVVQELNRMADQGFFGISMDRWLISHVARVSDGQFLWVGMLLKFLQSPLLSSEERLAILQNINLLQSLDSLYRNILGVLERRTKHEKRIINDAFRWLSFPINRLCPAALRAALSTFDPNSSGESNPIDLIHALPKLTCGFLNVSNDTISFAHRSIREYLQAPASQATKFSLYDESSVHAHLAARCLSYLAHDVPKRPLVALQPNSPHALPTIPTSSGTSQRTSASGDSGYKSLSSSSDGDPTTAHPVIRITPNPSIRTIHFDTHLPFLRYAALCWPIHLSRALSLLPNTATSSYPYLPALSAFLTSRLATTVWIEASYRYNFPPTLSRLVGPLSDLRGEITPATVEGRELRKVVDEMRELSGRLVGLKREHEGLLRHKPSLVWQMDGGGGGEVYWPVYED